MYVLDTKMRQFRSHDVAVLNGAVIICGVGDGYTNTGRTHDEIRQVTYDVQGDQGS